MGTTILSERLPHFSAGGSAGPVFWTCSVGVLRSRACGSPTSHVPASQPNRMPNLGSTRLTINR